MPVHPRHNERIKMLAGDGWIMCNNDNDNIIAAITGQICDDPAKSEEVFADVKAAVEETLRLTIDTTMRYDSDRFTLMCWPESSHPAGHKVIQVYKNVGCLWVDNGKLCGMIGNPNN